MRDPRLVLALLAGGFVGTVLRALLTDAWAHGPTAWPWATFAANVAGAFALGVVVAVLRTRPAVSLYWRPLLATGFCGGLTTFSTLQLELVRMVDERALGLAAAYLVVSIAFGLVAVSLGLRLGADVPASPTVLAKTPGDAAAGDRTPHAAHEPPVDRRERAAE